MYWKQEFANAIVLTCIASFLLTDKNSRVWDVNFFGFWSGGFQKKFDNHWPTAINLVYIFQYIATQ